MLQCFQKTYSLANWSARKCKRPGLNSVSQLLINHIFLMKGGTHNMAIVAPYRWNANLISFLAFVAHYKYFIAFFVQQKYLDFGWAKKILSHNKDFWSICCNKRFLGYASCTSLLIQNSDQAWRLCITIKSSCDIYVSVICSGDPNH